MTNDEMLLECLEHWADDPEMVDYLIDLFDGGDDD